MRRFRLSGIKVLIVIAALIAGFVVGSHLIFNSRHFQQLAIRFIHNHLKVELKWDRLTFNGATGRFHGENLRIRLPRTGATIELKDFNLVFEPLHLLIKKIHLLDLRANGLTITLPPVLEPQPPPPQDPNAPVQVTAQPPPPRSTLRDVDALLDLFDFKRAEIRDIRFFGPKGEDLSVAALELSSRNPVLIYKEAADLKISKVRLLSPKFDLFLDKFELGGDFKLETHAGRDIPALDLNANIKLVNLLAGFNKKPVPWNPAPAWDDSLTPLLSYHYPGGIPDNRAFGQFDLIQIPVTWQKDTVRIRNGSVQAMDGFLFIDGRWNRKKGGAEIRLETRTPFKLALLPLGKTKFRQSFERFTLDLAGKGKVTALNKGNLKANLKAELLGNRAENKKKALPKNLILQASPTYVNGVVGIPDLKITLGEGSVTGQGEINLPEKSLNASLSGSKLDTQTVVRLFSDMDIPGEAEVRGRISGALNNPTFDLSLESPGFGYESLHLGRFNGKLEIRDHRFRLSGSSSLEGGSGKLDLDIIEIFRTSLQEIRLQADFNGLPLGPVLQTPVISGKLDGSFRMAKKLQNYDGDGKLSATGILWYDVPIRSVSTAVNLKDKTLTFKSGQIHWNEAERPQAITRPFVFNFDQKGYRFEGGILPTVTAQGHFDKADPDILYAQVQARDTPLTFLAPVLPVKIDKFAVSGDFDVQYFMPDPKASQVKAVITKLDFAGEEKTIDLAQKTQIDYDNRRFVFHQSSWKIGNGRITLNGPLSFMDGSNLQIKGSMDLAQLNTLQPWLSEGSGLTHVDLNWLGSVAEPSFNGRVRFERATLFLPVLQRELSETNGTVELKGLRAQFSSFTTRYDEAPVSLDGWVEWSKDKKVSAASLSLSGKEIPLSKPDAWHVLTDADVHLRGSGSSLTLSGSLQVIDGLYYRDYSISQFILKPIGVTREIPYDPIPESFKDIRLNLGVRSLGDFTVKNNLADLLLRSDLTVKGATDAPELSGAIDVLEGEIHVLGVNFENATGFVTFTGSTDINPQVDFSASHEIQDHEIHVKIQGPADNLRLNLEATPALAQNDIVSLIAYGQTPEQLSDSDRSLFSTTAFASQVVGILQRPLEKATHLDIVRLESEYDPNSPTVSRFSIGKRLSERFSLSFTTDLSLDEAYKGVVIEYLLIDNLLLKGTKDTGSRYRFDLTYRFELY